MHHPTDRITHTTAFVTPVVEHWLEREIAQWVQERWRSVVQCALKMHRIGGSIPVSGPIILFLVPAIHKQGNTGRGTYCPVWGLVYVKYPLLLSKIVAMNWR